MANKNNNPVNNHEQDEQQSIIDNSELEDEKLKTRKLQAFGVIAFAIVILVMGGITMLSNFKNNNEEEKKETNIGTSIKKGDFSVKEDTQKLKEISLPPVEPNFKTQQINKDPFSPSPVKEKQTEVNFKPQVYKSSSSLLVANTSKTASSSNMNIGNSEVNENGERVFKTLSGEYVFDENGNFVRRNDDKPSILGGDGINSGSGGDYEMGAFTPKSAKVGSFNPSLYLSKGTYIGCSLDTRLISTIKGGISCTVSENVYSANGVTLLIEKGSKITGFFNSGQMNDGMERIFVVWNEIRTPNNIIIPVSSGASDELGGTGIPGYVDHHWLQRFGAAILLSIIDDGLNVALNGGSGSRRNNNVDYTENTRETTVQMANTALEKFINIQPTLYKNHGDIVGVYVNRDIDFSKVYKLKVRKDQIVK